MKGVWHMMKWVITEHYKNQFPFYWTHQGNTNWQCFRNLIVVWKPSKEDKNLEIYKAWQEAEAYFCHTNLPNLFYLFQWKETKNVHGDTFQATVFISGKLIAWITKRRLYYKLKWRGNRKTTRYLYLKTLPQTVKYRRGGPLHFGTLFIL